MGRTRRPFVVIHLCIEIVDRGCVARKLKLGYSAVGKDYGVSNELQQL